MIKTISQILSLIAFLIFLYGSAVCQTTAFTYQGKLSDGGNLANGQYDLVFRLFDSGGAQIGSDLPKDDVMVTAGIFTVTLDFGSSPFTAGTADSLEIAVRPGASTGAYTTLSPRQPLTSSPYALKSANASTADSLSAACVLCVTDSHIQSVDGSKVTGTVSSATTATVAGNVTGVVQIGNGGTGSSTKNFVDLSTDQSVAGNKTFSGAVGVTGGNGVFNGNGSGLTNLNGANITGGTITSTQLSSDALPNSSSLKLLGSQRWDLLKGQANFNVGTSPRGMAFDGSNIWVANGGDNTVTKLRATDGACVGTCTFSVGTTPNFLAFDGANIWVANSGSNNVTKLRASDGANLGTFTVGNFPFGIAYDGANIWVSNANANTVTKLRPSDGSSLGTFPVSSPGPIVFDGANLWVLLGTAGVTKVRPSDGASLCFLSQVDITISLVFDGTYILVGNAGTMTKVRTSDCASLGFINIGGGAANGVGFDGTNVWVTSNNNIVKVRVSDGTTLGVFSTGSSPNRFTFDGANMWVSNSNNTVTRMPPAFPL